MCIAIFFFPTLFHYRLLQVIDCSSLLSAEELMLLNSGVGEDSWESLGQKEIQPVNPEGSQPWIFIGRTDAKAPKLWSSDIKSQLIRKDPNAGKGWGKEKGMTGDNGWMSSLTQWTWVWANSRSLEWRTGKPAVLSTWGGKESDMTEQLNNNNNRLLSKSLRENGHRAHFWDY